MTGSCSYRQLLALYLHIQEVSRRLQGLSILIVSRITLILIVLILDYIDPVTRQVFSLQVRKVPSWQIKSHLLYLPAPRHKLRALCMATCCCFLLILFKSAC